MHARFTVYTWLVCVCLCVCVCVCVFVGVIYEKGREIFIEKEKMYGFWKAFVNFPAHAAAQASVQAGLSMTPTASPN